MVISITQESKANCPMSQVSVIGDRNEFNRERRYKDSTVPEYICVCPRSVVVKLQLVKKKM